MADMRQVDEARLIEQLRTETKCLSDRIEAIGREQVESLRQVLAAHREMPERSFDLLASATVAGVKEIQLRPSRNGLAEVNARISSEDIFSYQEIPHVPAGRYRVILFLVPLPERPES